MPESYGNAASTALTVADPPDAALHALDPKTLRARVREELAGRSLAGWESEFCRWLALQEKKPSEKDQLAVATALANRRVMRKELQGLKKRGPFVRLLAKEQGSQTDQEIESAKAIAAKVMPRGMELLGKMVEAGHTEIDESNDKMNVVRAVTPMVTALTDRVWPKKHESQAPTAITIHLSTHQVARIDAPEMQSEAVDVPYEVIAEEGAA